MRMSEEKPKAPDAPKDPVTLPEPPAPIETKHKTAGLEYTARAGLMPIKNNKGDIEAHLFFTSYTLDGQDPAQRPLLFAFNGGPGSSSVWLHLGIIGPKRVKMEPDGNLPAPPYELVDNPETWLHHADLVFIDPVGTGYSRAATPELSEKFWGLEGDIASVGEFIRLYLSRYQRWASPLYLSGESYGTTRAAGLAGYLIDWGIAFKGILLVSSVLNFQTLDFTHGNDLPFALFLPTFAATARFHGKAKRQNMAAFLKEVERFASGEYLRALHEGDAMPKSQRKAVVAKLSAYTGLSAEYLEQCNLRPNIHAFCKELLRSQGLTVGRLDSRFKGFDASGTSETPEYDPSMSAIRPPYTACMNDYVNRTLGYTSDETYRILGEGGEPLWKKWNWGSAREGHPDTSRALRNAFARNPHMKVMIASGYYDLATPYFATEYTLNHMGLERFRKSVTTSYYEAGHMMYIDEVELTKLSADVTSFFG